MGDHPLSLGTTASMALAATDPTTVEIRALVSLEDREQAVALQEATWGAGFKERIPAAMLLIAEKTGGVAGGAFAADGRMLGFVFGVVGVRDGTLFHWSDMLALEPAARGLGLAERLKHWQAARCRALGIREMFWTFDPLVARNAWFNLRRLGAEIAEYVENIYGVTDSPLMGAIPTDRFVARWRMDAPSAPRTDAPWRLPLPSDFEALVRDDAAAATAARFAFREAVQAHVAAGRHVVGITRGPEGTVYLLDER
jgi:predicted GNAT superfamily acetyltransferase